MYTSQATGPDPSAVQDHSLHWDSSVWLQRLHHNYYSCGEYNLDVISILPENQRLFCCQNLSILLNRFIFFPLKPAPSFFFFSFFLFYSLYSASKCTLSPFHFFFRTVSLLPHKPVHHGFISLYSLSLMDYVVAEIQVPSHYQIHLFFSPSKEWEIICVIWRDWDMYFFLLYKNIEATVRTKTTELGKYRFGCLTNQLDSIETKQTHTGQNKL